MCGGEGEGVCEEGGVCGEGCVGERGVEERDVERGVWGEVWRRGVCEGRGVERRRVWRRGGRGV